MRTTLNLDPELLDAAKRLAIASARTVSEVISELALRSLNSPPPVKRVKGVLVFDVSKDAVPKDAVPKDSFPKDAKPFSLEDIRREDSEG